MPLYDSAACSVERCTPVLHRGTVAVVANVTRAVSRRHETREGVIYGSLEACLWGEETAPCFGVVVPCCDTVSVCGSVPYYVVWEKARTRSDIFQDLDRPPIDPLL